MPPTFTQHTPRHALFHGPQELIEWQGVPPAFHDPHLTTHPHTLTHAPQELIEWQPVYHQRGAQGLDAGAWSATWQLTRSSKVSVDGQPVYRHVRPDPARTVLGSAELQWTWLPARAACELKPATVVQELLRMRFPTCMCR